NNGRNGTGTLNFRSGAILQGAGTILFTGGDNPDDLQSGRWISIAGTAEPFIHPAGHRIIGGSGGVGAGSFVNQGEIRSTTPGHRVSVGVGESSTLANTGVLAAENGGILQLSTGGGAQIAGDLICT